MVNLQEKAWRETAVMTVAMAKESPLHTVSSAESPSDVTERQKMGRKVWREKFPPFSVL